MPRGDGKGPPDRGGRGAGKGMGKGRGMGRMEGTRPQCVCPSCGATLPHELGVPCYQTVCPHCGATMVKK